jgi:hypothetical protein
MGFKLGHFSQGGKYISTVLKQTLQENSLTQER